MKIFFVSAFSNRMVTPPCVCVFKPLTHQEVVTLVEKNEVMNRVNPRHESTSKASRALLGCEAEGGFVSLQGGDSAVILLPKEQSRTGEEFCFSEESAIYTLVEVLPMEDV